MYLLPLSDLLVHLWPLTFCWDSCCQSSVHGCCSCLSCGQLASLEPLLRLLLRGLLVSIIAGPSPVVSNRRCLSCSSLACLVFSRSCCCLGSVQGHLRMLKAPWSHVELVNGSVDKTPSLDCNEAERVMRSSCNKAGLISAAKQRSW